MVYSRVANKRSRSDKKKIQCIFHIPHFTSQDLVKNTSLEAGLLVLQIKIPSGIHLLGSSEGGICIEFFFFVTSTSPWGPVSSAGKSAIANPLVYSPISALYPLTSAAAAGLALASLDTYLYSSLAPSTPKRNRSHESEKTF